MSSSNQGNSSQANQQQSGQSYPPPPPGGPGNQQPYFPTPYGFPNPNGSFMNFQTDPNMKTQNSALRNRMRMPFELTLCSTMQIYVFDQSQNQFVTPKTTRENEAVGFQLFFGLTSFKQQETLNKHKIECLQFLEREGIATDIAKYPNQQFLSDAQIRYNTSRNIPNPEVGSHSSNSSKSFADSKILEILSSLGITGKQATVPTPEDNLKSQLLSSLASLGIPVQDLIQPSNKDPLDIKIRELEDQLKQQQAAAAEAAKPPCPKQAKIHQLELELQKATAALPSQPSQPSQKPSPAEATSSKNKEQIPQWILDREREAAEAIENQQATITQLQKLLNNQDLIIQQADADKLSIHKAANEDNTALQLRCSQMQKQLDKRTTIVVQDGISDSEHTESSEAPITPSDAISRTRGRTPQSAHRSAPSKSSANNRASSSHSTPTKRKLPTEENAEQGNKLINALQRAARDKKLTTPRNFIAAFKKLDHYNTIQFYKHFNVCGINDTQRYMHCQSNITKAVQVLQSKCLLHSED